MDRYDAVVVGARPAGATLAALLARSGWRVLLVDRSHFPSDTVSTHMIFPDTLDLLDRLGVMQRLRAGHDIRLLKFSWRGLGYDVAGSFSPVGGYDRGACIRRIVLDQALIDTAAALGAQVRPGTGVKDLVGSGSSDDPVRAVVLDSGETVEATWVFGADGRASTVARRLGLPATRERRGGMAFLLAYWRGLPPSQWCRLDIHEESVLMSAPCEDGFHLLSLGGPPRISSGSGAERERRYLEGLRQFPAVLNPRLLDLAHRATPLVVVPETMMRGYYRPASGAGWALVGDAGHFKHPATAQGIGDAVQQSWHVGTTLAEGGDMSGFQQWRDDRAEAHYEWSFRLARFGSGRARAMYAGLAVDRPAGQEFLDLFTRRHRPSEVLTSQRMSRWEAAWAYEEGQRSIRALVENLDRAALSTVVPACPEWTVRDLLAHLVGVARDSARGAFFPGALDAWRQPQVAERREHWTAGHVADYRDQPASELLCVFDEHAGHLVTMLRTGAGPVFDGPAWMVTAPVADLAVHLHDLSEALGRDPDDGSAVARLGFSVYRSWLSARIVERGLASLRLSDGEREWTLGEGEPAVTLTADRHELFRAITGRRSLSRLRAYKWDGDPVPYLPVISPYPLPPDRVPAGQSA